MLACLNLNNPFLVWAADVFGTVAQSETSLELTSEHTVS